MTHEGTWRRQLELEEEVAELRKQLRDEIRREERLASQLLLYQTMYPMPRGADKKLLPLSRRPQSARPRLADLQVHLHAYSRKDGQGNNYMVNCYC